ncbi:hypothetical protein KY285_005273 [Solanum tuberosum]|nr:hypothetical protein KY285_005273 [Solanum tuberosum]
MLDCFPPRLDSGCSNHITCVKSLFHELDEKEKKKVQLDNTKELLVKGKGTLSIDTNQDKVNMIDNVQFVPNFGYNLLSVGQLMTNGYSLWFDDDAFVITTLAANAKDDSKLWYLRYGHLNKNGLNLLGDKGMVLGLPKNSSLDLCERGFEVVCVLLFWLFNGDLVVGLAVRLKLANNGDLKRKTGKGADGFRCLSWPKMESGSCELLTSWVSWEI